jgi:hypothetical protein
MRHNTPQTDALVKRSKTMAQIRMRLSDDLVEALKQEMPDEEYASAISKVLRERYLVDAKFERSEGSVLAATVLRLWRFQEYVEGRAIKLNEASAAHAYYNILVFLDHVFGAIADDQKENAQRRVNLLRAISGLSDDMLLAAARADNMMTRKAG